MQRTLSLRIYPNKAQERHVRECLFLASLVHNAAIAERQIHYRNTGRSPSAYDQIKELPALKREDPRFQCIPANALQQVLLRVEKAYHAFFAKRARYPRFIRARYYRSLTFPKSVGDFKVDERRVWLTKLGWMKARGQRCDWLKQWSPKSSVVELRPSGKWMLHVQCELADAKSKVSMGGEIGLDAGLASLIATSDGETVANPRHLRRAEARLRRLQCQLSRKKKGSRNRDRHRRLLARQYEKVRNARRDFNHKLSRKLVDEHGFIAVEGGLHGLGRGALAKGVNDAAWGQLFRFIEYKAEETETLVVRVEPRGTSQECSQCRNMSPKDLADRIHSCPHCGLVLDRDINAAKNILARGLRLRDELGQPMPKGTPVETRGDKTHPRPVLVAEAGTPTALRG